MRSARRITNRVTPADAIADCSPSPGSKAKAVTRFPAAVTAAAGSAVNATARSLSVNTPSRFGARAGRRISAAGSLPAAFAPSWSQNNPWTASHPLGAVSSSRRCLRYCSISARYDAGASTAPRIANASIRTRIRNDSVPFVRAGSRDNGDDGFRVAEIVDFVRDARRDEDAASPDPHQPVVPLDLRRPVLVHFPSILSP